MTPQRWDDLVALAALGELTSEEQAELDAAVQADPVRAGELDEALATAAMLQHRHVIAPPASLRANVLAAIARTPQDGPGVDEQRSTGDSSGGGHHAPVVSLQDRRRRRMLPIMLGAAAAVVFLVGAFLVSNEAAAPDQFAAVIEASDAETHQLAGDLGGTLTVTYSPALDAMVLEGDGIRVLDEDATYQLWVDIDGHMTPAGLFRPDDDGEVRERIDGIDTTGESINVTAEPAGGSQEPTLPVLASA